MEEAIAEYGQAIRLDPEATVAYYNRGVAYQEQLQFQLAIEDYNDAIRLDPSYFDAYNNRGGAYIALGEYGRALQDLDLAIRLNPKDDEFFTVSNQQKWDTLGAERSGAGWRSGELPEGPVVASSPFGGLSLHLLPAL